MARSFWLALLGSTVLAVSGLHRVALADGQTNKGGTLVVARVQYVSPSPLPAPPNTFPQIFNNTNVSGIQGNIFLDYYGTQPGAPRQATLPLTAASVQQSQPVITTSFSSKSEGSLHLSLDGHYVTYMGYNAAAGLEGVSNSETTNPAAQVPGGCSPTPCYDRAVALIDYNGLVSVTPENFAYSGDNPRGAITLDGKQFYMAGNSDNTLNKTNPVTGPGLTIGARLGTPGSPSSIQLGVYTAADRPDESAKQHIKDNNFRGIGIFPDANGNENLYVSKGSGGNGDDGLFQVLDGSHPGATINDVVNNGTGAGIPAGGTDNTIVQLLGNYATNPNTNQPSPITPFGFFFANPSTLYVADEGNSTITLPTGSNETTTSLTTDPLAGLQKWILVPGSSPYWQLVYVIRRGLQINQPQNIPGYGVPTYTTGLRNLTGQVNSDNGTVTIYAITAQTSTVSGGEPDPTKLVAVTDEIAATQLPVSNGDGYGNWGDGNSGGGQQQQLDEFVTLQQSRSGEVFRGVAFAPSP
ncbi:MAG: hypothetical protein JO081_06635 [Alphaproteobacteria bacterium]|nr:hypothetical protein [Alphaproteobacteria bacterium]